ncbi:Takeout/JHBP like protein, partial [Gryllus bimaculatus]
MSLQRNNNLLPTLAFNLTDSVHEGWKDAVVLHSKANPKERKFKLVINIPRYRFSGPYDVTGSIIGIPLEGSGDMNCTFYNMTNDILMRGHLEERFAQEYFVIDDFHQKTHVDKMTVYLGNLFNDPKLTEATNKLLNENNRAVIDEASDVLNEVWGAVHAGLMQRIFRRVPYRVMFPGILLEADNANDKKHIVSHRRKYSIETSPKETFIELIVNKTHFSLLFKYLFSHSLLKYLEI